MRNRMIALMLLWLLPCLLMAQQPAAPPRAPEAPKVTPPPPELGKWWKNSEIVNKLQITETQVKQIEQVFLDHRLKLVDLRAELERRELQMKPLMDVDRPDEAKVMAQTERITAARGELEKANTSMMLAIRRVLSVEQWKKLEEVREQRKLPAPPAPPAPPPPPAPPKPPSGGLDYVGVYTTGGDVKPPVAVYQPLPTYTPEAKEAKVEGIVLVQMIIRKDGSVDKAKVIRGLGYGLDEAAVNAIVNQWKFRPGTLHGKPVDVQANVEMSFRFH